MTLEVPNEPARLALDLEWYARDMGLTLLSDKVALDSLPPHLRNDFVRRPWPKHSLDTAIIERFYIPPIPAVHTPEAWTLEIVDDHRIRVGDKSFGVRGARILSLLNIFLLCRDVSLEFKDFCALGFGAEIRARNLKNANFHILYEKLQEKCEPYNLFVERGVLQQGGYRINPAMRIVDRREFNERAFDPELIY